MTTWCADDNPHGQHEECPGRLYKRRPPRRSRRVRYGRAQRIDRRTHGWRCEVKLPNGATCRRPTDRGVCPVHPPILDLDELRVLTIGQRVRYLRELRGMSQPVLAGLFGMSASYLQKIEQGIRPGDRIGFLLMVSTVLRVPLYDLISGYREVMKR